MDGPGAAVVDGMLYINSGYGGFVGRPGNVLLAFGVDFSSALRDKQATVERAMRTIKALAVVMTVKLLASATSRARARRAGSRAARGTGAERPIVGSGQLLQPDRRRPRQGDRVLPRRHRPRRHRGAGQRRREPGAAEHVRLARRADPLVDRPAAGDAHGRRDRRRSRRPAARALERRIQDTGAFTLIVVVRDIDAAFASVKQVGAPVVTSGGVPVSFGTSPKVRAVIVKDPDGHFVELTQPDPLPPATAPDPPNVIGVRVRLTVEDAEKAMRLYWDALGTRGLTPGSSTATKPCSICWA